MLCQMSKTVCPPVTCMMCCCHGQVAVHAIGDRAVDDVLDIYASLPSAGASGSSEAVAAAPAGPPRSKPRRHRIEHAQHIAGPSTAQRMAAAGVLTTPNPLHLLADAAILESRLGAARAGPGRSYPLKTLLKVRADRWA